MLKEGNGALSTRSYALACWVPKAIAFLVLSSLLMLAGYSYHSHRLLVSLEGRSVDLGLARNQNAGKELQLEALTERLHDLEAKIATLSRRESDLALLTQEYNAQLGLPEGTELEGIWPELVNTVSWTWGGQNAQGGFEPKRGAGSQEVSPIEVVRGLHRDLDRLVESAEATELALSELSAALEGSSSLLAVTPYANPVPNGKVSSLFGYRSSPFRGGGLDFHQGLDLSAPIGSPVYAPADGVVLSSDWSKSGYGRMVTLDHGFGLSTRYAHLSESLVEVGDEVKRGDMIAKVGSTGRSTGPHLHYETLMGGVAVDPWGFIKADLGIKDESALGIGGLGGRGARGKAAKDGKAAKNGKGAKGAKRGG
ncbi:MAG: M23 family metallopeptidase [Deltaproteobacteria bacterium]|nr:M23 family metallopeptidase [Deltaproteobacteria bacterium]